MDSPGGSTEALEKLIRKDHWTDYKYQHVIVLKLVRTLLG
jgi:hypothetical protein